MRPAEKHGRVWRKGLRFFTRRGPRPKRYQPVYQTHPLPPREEIIFFPDRHPLLVNSSLVDD